MNQNYLVTLHIQSGEHSLKSLHLISAASEEQAEIVAIENEARGELDWDEYGAAFDCHGELAYSAEKITVIPDEDLPVLEKYHGSISSRAEYTNGEEESHSASPR